MIDVVTHETDLLAGFTRVERHGKVALVHPDWREPLAAALLDGAGCRPLTTRSGRGGVLQVDLDGLHAVIRPYRRGGMMRHLLKDSFLFINRPLHELRVLAYLHANGLPAPQPLGACWERRGPLIRGAIATRHVEAQDLVGLLSSSGNVPEDVLLEVGRLIASLHACNVRHADLQAGNILVGDGAVYLIDFDKARLYSRLTRRQCARNLLRLRRSLQKNGFSERCFPLICEGYGQNPIPRWLDVAYRIKGTLADWLSV